MLEAAQTRSRRGRALRGEAVLAQAWADRRFLPAELVDQKGEALQLVFPGRRWGGPGPDFKGALLARPDGTLLRGDVEIHLRASDWVRHGHATDPAYAGVILHVVRVNDAPAIALGGAMVPTIVLNPARVVPLPVLTPCLHHTSDILAAVHAAGLERFFSRAARYEGDIEAVGAEQALWRGLAEGMGYSRNTRPFSALADGVSWPEAAQTLRRHGVLGLTARLLGEGGLLAWATPDEERAWGDVQRESPARLWLAVGAWELASVRPANHPAVRCRGLARIAERLLRTGSAQDVAREVARSAEERQPAPWRLLEERPWVGRGRALAMTASVLLPFAAALGVAEAEDVYQRMAGEPASRPARHMAETLGLHIARPTTC